MAQLSKSRNVCGFIRRTRRAAKLQARLDAKLATLEPLQRQVRQAKADALVAWGKLNGRMRTEAERILREVL